MTLRKPLVDATSPIELPAGDYLESDVGLITMNYDATGPFPMCTPVYPGNSNIINKAKADASTTSRVLGLVLDSGDAVVQTDGVLTATAAQWDAVVTGASGGLTANTVYFLDAVNAGKLTPTAPTTAGKLVARVGKAVSATQMQINIEPPILL